MAVETTAPVPAYSIPTCFLLRSPPSDNCFRKFKTGDLRQKFLHVPLTANEIRDLRQAQRAARHAGVTLTPDLCALLARYLQFFRRKEGAAHVNLALANCQTVLEFRKRTYPLKDTEHSLRADLQEGSLYWLGRDRNYRPILFCNLNTFVRLPPLRMLRLMLFVFEWGRRYLSEFEGE